MPEEHEHDWERYFSGWVCLGCRAKSGYDYVEGNPINGKPSKHKIINDEVD